MPQKQLSKYEDLRKRILKNPGQVKVTSRQKMIEELPHVSLNFPINYKLWPGIMNVMGKLEKADPGHEYIYPSAFHCTLELCGILGKNISQDDIPVIISKVNAALKNFKGFEVTLRGFNSFGTNTFVQVFSPDNKLFKLHNLLNSIIAHNEPEFEGENYVPHVAVIYYHHKPDKLFSILNKYSDILIGKMRVGKINLIKGEPSLLVNRMEVIRSWQI